jgi:hypothetical protein
MSPSESPESAVEHHHAAIHDLGYQRYVGTRRPQRTRYQVIVRNLLSMSWQGWWRYKAQLGVAAMITVGVGVVMYFSRSKLFSQAQIGGQIRTVADGLIPMSYGFYGWASFVVSLTVLASVISRDLGAGAFDFYFSRPVRPVDYVVGKVSGAFLLLAPITLLGPVLLTVYRLALTGDVGQAMDTLPWIPRAILVGVVATMAYACVPLAMGALSSRPRNAVAGYAAFFLVFGGIAKGVSVGTGVSELAALNLSSAVNGFASGVFDVVFINGEPLPGLWISLASILLYVLLSIAFILFRVRRAQRLGIGGA